MRPRAQCKRETAETATAATISPASKRRGKKAATAGGRRNLHRAACRRTRSQFLICPAEGGGGDVLTELGGGASGSSRECHLCHDGGIKCILGHHVPKEVLKVIRWAGTGDNRRQLEHISNHIF